MRAASAQWQRRARCAHAMPCHRPLQLLVMRHTRDTLSRPLSVENAVSSSQTTDTSSTTNVCIRSTSRKFSESAMAACPCGEVSARCNDPMSSNHISAKPSQGNAEPSSVAPAWFWTYLRTPGIAAPIGACTSRQWRRNSSKAIPGRRCSRKTNLTIGTALPWPSLWGEKPTPPMAAANVETRNFRLFTRVPFFYSLRRGLVESRYPTDATTRATNVGRA